MDAAAILIRALAGPADNASASLAALIEEEAPGHSYLVSDGWAPQLQEFAQAGECRITPIAGAPLILSGEYLPESSRTKGSLSGGCFQVEWQSVRVTVFLIHVPNGHSVRDTALIVAESQAEAYRFHDAVCRWWNDQKTGILVYDGQNFERNPDLRESIRKSTLDDVVLAGDQKRTIASDVADFFSSQATYVDYRIPWKRGLIFTGPPGNGKTQMVKALINHVDKPCLYVRSFGPETDLPLESIEKVFRQARQIAPCVMVLEDLDSMVTERNRAAFLNELDGFYENNGILALATTNYPEKLDSAILDRPSRFDRKYFFAMPGTEERVKYMDLLSLRLDEKARPTDEMIYQIALETDGFSFAYLKELFLSALMNWVHAQPKPTIPQSIMKMIPVLREQIRAAQEALAEKEAEEPAA